MRGFEPRTSCSQSRRANQAALHPVFVPFYCAFMRGATVQSVDDLATHPQLPTLATRVEQVQDSGQGGSAFSSSGVRMTVNN